MKYSKKFINFPKENSVKNKFLTRPFVFQQSRQTLKHARLIYFILEQMSLYIAMILKQKII